MTHSAEVTDRSLLAIAGAASIAAGMVHAAAAGSHTGDDTLVKLFAATAAIQVLWGVVALVRPNRPVAFAGFGLNTLFVLAWVLSRTTGLPVVDALREVEAVGTQDVLAAAFGAVAAASAILAVSQPVRRTTMGGGWVIGSVVVMSIVAVPAMAAEHSHTGSHAHSSDPAVAHADDGHDHSAGEGETAAGAASDATGAGAHDHAIPAHLDHEPTPEQMAEAAALLAETKTATAQYNDIAAAEAAGFRSIGDGFTGVEHWINSEFMADSAILDPERPESIVYRVNPDRTKELITVMYILPRGWTMDDVPDIAGNLTVWHDHDNLCFDPETSRLSGVFVDGKCRPAGVHVQTAPMLHVWVTPNPCGPFAGTDKQQMTGSCVADSGL
jgi:hypothetical protein